MLEEVRTSCAAVMRRATWVTIRHERLGPYAAAFTDAELRDPVDTPNSAPTDAAGTEARVALVLALDAINFGSGYHPLVHKRPGCSGAVTMAAALRDWAAATGPITPERLLSLRPDEVHRIFDQPDDGGAVHQLMRYFTTALTDLGALITRHGSFSSFVAAADRSADRLVLQLAELPYFRDRARHHGHEVLFFKRAQLSAADLAREFGGQGPGRFDDLDRLTAFADNLVPHVLRIDGVLRFEPELVARIDRNELLAAGCAEEVEIRAAGVHAVELLRDELAERGRVVRSSRLDEVLWTRGGAARFKAHPRHRTRSVFY
jgi:hypothetical protein